jgi:predicted acylesterase/phospholipase RssA
MGKVVNLQDQAAPASGSKRGRPGSQRSTAAGRSGRRPRPSKTALVLGGGGFTGAVYEIGALRAFDLLSVSHTINQFDVYVGTSAGSLVASAVANGITPEQMMQAIVREGPDQLPDARANALLRPNYREFVTRGVRFPLKLLSLLRMLSRELGQVSAMDIVLALAEALPTGLYTGDGLERYVRDVLSPAGRSDDFRDLDVELYLTGTDLDSCERVVFGAQGLEDVPISRAVAASCAIPMLYKPVEIKDRVYVDGGLVSTTNIDVAVDAGAKFVVVVNPLVPYVGDITESGSSRRRVSQMGFPQIGYQSFKLLAHQRLHELARGWEDRYPGVDIILIEPDPNDELMFQTGVMNFTSRVEIARHGFESVTLHLAADYPRFKQICARHGIEISAERVRTIVRHFEAERESTRAWRKILEQTTATLLRQSAAQ